MLSIYAKYTIINSLSLLLKAEVPSDVVNYCPIANLSHIANIFESLVLSTIQPQVNSFFIEEQHGFRPGRSTITCNLVFTSFILESFAHQTQVRLFILIFLRLSIESTVYSY